MSPSDDLEYFGAEGEPLEGATPSAVRRTLEDADGDFDALDVELCALPENDLANAKRLEARNEGRIWWTREWGPGVWDGRRFDFDHGHAKVGILAQQTAERLLTHEVSAFHETQRLPRESGDDWEMRLKRFHGFALQAGNNGRTEAMLKQAERRLTRPLAHFDADKDRLAVANGTLELPGDGRDVRFVPHHDPAHLISRVAGAAYDPKARAPQWEAFLAKVQPEPEMRGFLARWIGYCLTGHVDEQAYVIFQGQGGDGKSTFLEALGATLGGYVANAAIETFLARERKGNEASPDIARLASGVRLVKASEPEQGATLAESMLKIVTGGEPIPTRAMYREPFEFIPDWKLVISCNRKPKIRGDDRGIWRRTLVVPWPVSIPQDEMDQQLKYKLQAEASGILNWALRGWADWLEQGLAPPQAVKDAVAEYRLSSNPFGVWADSCCDRGDGLRWGATALYDSYCGFVRELGAEPMNQTAFGRALGDRGLERKKSDGTIWRLGVRLNALGQEYAKRTTDDGEGH